MYDCIVKFPLRSEVIGPPPKDQRKAENEFGYPDWWRTNRSCSRPSGTARSSGRWLSQGVLQVSQYCVGHLIRRISVYPRLIYKSREDAFCAKFGICNVSRVSSFPAILSPPFLLYYKEP